MQYTKYTNKTVLSLTLVFLSMGIAQAKEKLFVPVDDTWKSIPSKNKNIKEFIPMNEKESAWTRIITVKEMPGNKISSDSYALSVQELVKKSEQCMKYVTAPPVKRPEKGFEESVITFQCLQKDSKYKTFISKTMESPSGLYEVRYSFISDTKGKYKNKLLKDYLLEDVIVFMKSVTLCDDSIKDRACPVVSH